EYLPWLKNNYRYFDLNFSYKELTPDKNMRVTTRKGQFIDLRKGWDSSLQGPKKNLKRAAKAALSCIWDYPPEKIINAAREELKEKVPALGANEYDMLLTLFYSARERGKAYTMAAVDPDGNICGSAIFLNHNSRIVFLRSAQHPKGKDTGGVS